jgi:hypothetical protein
LSKRIATARERDTRPRPRHETDQIGIDKRMELTLHDWERIS